MLWHREVDTNPSQIGSDVACALLQSAMRAFRGVRDDNTGGEAALLAEYAELVLLPDLSRSV